MATRLVGVLVDSVNPLAAATFWAQALGSAAGLLDFVTVPEPKTVKNRVHLDLASTSRADQAAQVERLVGLGATRIDIGQGDVPWVVLADPEGNEFCVLEPRPVYLDAGPVAAIVVDCMDPEVMARFWTIATGWPVTSSDEELIALRSASGQGPFVELLCLPALRSDEPKRVKNRVHLEIAPFAGDDQAGEVARLHAAGATLTDVGQRGGEGRIVMSDPEGQEFCLLTPR